MKAAITLQSLVVIAGIIFIDRVTKLWALSHCLSHGIERCTVTSFLSYEIIFNRGISWSIGTHMSPIAHIFLMIGIVLLLCFCSYALFVSTKRNYLDYGLLCILGGALGNILDRIWYGAVVDFIVLQYAGWVFPTFNVADMCICFGAAYWWYKQ